MPFGSVRLVPGVNVEKTPTLLEASISQSQLVRFKDSLVQKYGGWTLFYGLLVPGIPRDLHAWQDLNQVDHLAVGTTTSLSIITNGALQDITPQTLITGAGEELIVNTADEVFSGNPLANITIYNLQSFLTATNPPDFTTTMGSPVVTVTDQNITNVTVYDAVFFNTPVSVDGIILAGQYAITEITGTNSYDIVATSNGLAGVTDGGALPEFTTTSGSSIVKVTFANHGKVVGNTVFFPISSTGNGVTINGTYTVISVIDVDNFNITSSTQADMTGSFFMNSGNCQLVYFIAIGPPAVGGGYGLGTYGSGGYGTGTTVSVQTGIPITATDWTLDNWGEILLACPAGGGVYQYDPTGGFTNAGIIPNAPAFNSGIFVSQSQQILVCYGSSGSPVSGDLSIQENPLQVSWSTVGDFTNFTPLTTDQAGSFIIPIGSKITCGMAVANQDLIWTDLDLWAMNYIGPPFIFGFNQIGSGAGAVSRHAMQRLRGGVYWMGPQNFFSLGSGGATVIPCPVWDFVFQNINTDFLANVRAMPNTPFNEAGWLFPSAASESGECDSYVKFNITEPNGPWDYGLLPRSAWIDQGVLGSPIGASPQGAIYQHEETNDAAGTALASSFTTGYFMIAEGEDFAFVDQIYPDMKWGTYPGTNGAVVQLTFNVTNFPGDTPTPYGPYTVDRQTEILTVRFRGRQMSITLQSNDIGAFGVLDDCGIDTPLQGDAEMASLDDINSTLKGIVVNLGQLTAAFNALAGALGSIATGN